MRSRRFSPDSIAGRADALRPFLCSWTSGGVDAAWVHVAGALDIATTPQLEQVLRERQSQARLVVLDLRDLAFMDSAGVHTIVDATARARKFGRRLVLLRGAPNVDRLLRLTGHLDDVEIGDLDPALSPVETLLVREPRR